MKFITGCFLAFVLAVVLNAGEVDQEIKRMLDQNNMKYTIDSDNDFRLPFSDGNTVIVNSNVESYQKLSIREIRVILEEIGSKNNLLLYKMLQENFKRKIGAYSLTVSNDKVYAIYRITLPSNASWNELYSAILYCSNMKLPD